MTKKIIAWIKSHRTISILIVLAIGGSIWGYYHFFPAITPTTYVLATVNTGTIVSSVSGSGQVSASRQVDIKAKASGDVIKVLAKNDQVVTNGQILAYLDSSEAQKSVRDAQANLDSALLSLEKLQQPTDALTLLQAQNSLVQAKETKQNDIVSLTKSYEDGYNTVADTFLDLPVIMTGLNDIIYGNNFRNSQVNIDYYASSAASDTDDKIYQYRSDATTAYQTARDAYDVTFDTYKATSRFSDTTTIGQLIGQTYDTTKLVAEAVKSAHDFLQLYQDEMVAQDFTPVTQSDTHITQLNGYTGTTSSFLSSLLAIRTTIQNNTDALVSADRTIAEKTASLAKTQAGTDAIDLKSQQLSIQQRRNALADAQANLADYAVRAPFTGTITNFDIKAGDTVSSGGTVATLLADQFLATISLNEVDVAKVEVGQKVTLTFDAIEDLTISGEVIEVNTLGTVSSGVVTYDVKIGFDTQNDRIKSGMTVIASIITLAKQDIILVSSSALKTSGDITYVEMPAETEAASIDVTQIDSRGISLQSSLRQQIVEIGLSDDTNTEITSGLNVGDLIITRTISSASKSSTSSSTSSNSNGSGSLFDMGGGGPPGM